MTAVAALMSGCSADSTRFGDAFGNPFATGSIPKPKKVVHKAPVGGTGRTPPVTASALPPVGHVAAASPMRAAPPAVSHETTGSIPSARSVPGASFGGWTGQGGASVQVGEGDTAAVLAQRYGVPENVLLQTNGLHAAGEVRPGTTIVIPIYNAVASAPGAARVAQSAPVRSEPVEPEERPAPVRTVPAHVAQAEAPAEPARKPAALPFKVERASTLAERNAEAQRIVATQRAADKAAAEKLAAAQKAAEAQKLAEARKAAAAEQAAAAEKAKAEAARKVAMKSAPKADPKAAAAARAEAAKVAAAGKAAAAQKLAADREAAKAKAEAARTAAAAAKAAKVAAAAPPPAKAEQAAAVEKKVDATPTASVPPASAAAVAAPASATPAALADAGGPEFRWPAHGRIIGGFKTGGNDGINIAVPEGTAVKAAEGGTVAYAGNELKGYGNMVLIRHPNGYVTAYANNGEIDVKKGDVVKRGQLIAKSGQTGDVASPQLHFELRKGSTPVDPTNFLAGT